MFAGSIKIGRHWLAIFCCFAQSDSCLRAISTLILSPSIHLWRQAAETSSIQRGVAAIWAVCREFNAEALHYKHNHYNLEHAESEREVFDVCSCTLWTSTSFQNVFFKFILQRCSGLETKQTCIHVHNVPAHLQWAFKGVACGIFSKHWWL